MSDLTKQITCGFDKETVRMLDEISSRSGVSRQDIIREAVRNWTLDHIAQRGRCPCASPCASPDAAPTTHNPKDTP